MRIDLIEDPAVIGMALTLGVDEYAVVGRLHRLWGWANRQSSDGHAAGITAEWIDRLVTQTGFAAAMQHVGWLELNACGAVFPKFERHNGQSAKVRVLAASRQQVRRANTASRVERDKPVTREEEEKNITSPLPPAGERAFKALLAEYPAHRRNVRAALKRWSAIDPDAALQERIVRAVRAQARSPEWQADQGKHVPNLSKWLHNEGWKRTHDDSAPVVKQPVTNSQSLGVALTTEQLAVNKERARRLAEETRKAVAEKRLQGSCPGGALSRKPVAGELRLIQRGDAAQKAPASSTQRVTTNLRSWGHPQ